MAERLVIDASVGIAHVRDEVGTVAVDIALRAWSDAGVSLVVPAVFWTEVLNSLGTRHRYTAAEMAEALRELDELDIETLEVDRAGLLLVADAVERHGMSAYDASYLVLAQLLDAPLATLDRRLAAVAGPAGILIDHPEGEHGVRETPAPYARRREAGRPSSLPDYAGLGAYLGELRRRAMAGTR